MKNLLILQYSLVGIRNLLGVVLISVLDPNQLGLFKVFSNITNNSRFLQLGVPSYIVFRATGTSNACRMAYAKLLLSANYFALIFLFPYTIILSFIFDLNSIIITFAILIQSLSTLLNNSIGSIERIQGKLYIYLITNFASNTGLIFSPLLLFVIDREIDFKSVLLIYCIINFILSLFIAGLRKYTIIDTYRKGILKFRKILLHIKISIVQILFSILLSLNLMIDNLIFIKTFDLAYLGNYSVFLVYVSLYSQFYSVLTVYLFKRHTVLFERPNIKLLITIIAVGMAGLLLSLYFKELVIYILSHLDDYYLAIQFIENYWWVSGLIVFRFCLPNYYFRSKKTNNLIWLTILLILIKFALIVLNIELVEPIILTFDALLGSVILIHYVATMVREA